METIAHYHFQTVHFPIALTLASLLLMLLGSVKESISLKTAARYVLYLAAIGSLVAMTTGLLAEEYLPHSHEGEIHNIMEWHESLGIGIAASLVVTASLSFLAAKKNKMGLQRLVLALVLVISAAVSVTGYLGGRLGHEFGIGVDKPDTPPIKPEKEHHHEHEHVH